MQRKEMVITMLSRKNTAEKIDSIIGTDAVVEGNLTTGSITRIDGSVQGNIKSKGTLIVGSGGSVKGNIEALQVMIAGEVTGDLFVQEKIEVSSSGKVIGNIHTKSLVVDENAVFQGQCIMNVGKDGQRTGQQQPEEKQDSETSQPLDIS